jgi:dephospho-CoA kinase
MIKIGLTGSIGSGKSSIARKATEELGIPVFDADKAVRDMYAKDQGMRDFLVEKCGPDIIRDDGQVNRDMLLHLMRTPEKRYEWREIETEVHRRVWSQFDDFAKEKAAAGHTHVIGDVPLLFETGAEDKFNYTVNVFLPYAAQKQRALAREEPKLTEADFERRYSAFMSTEKRNKKADFVIDNSGEIAASLLQLRFHMSNMRDKEAPASALSTSFNEAAVYVGSFDPMTLGHVDVVKSAAKMPYQKLYVAVGINPAKKPMFSTEERLAMIEREMDRDVRPHLPPSQKIIVTAYEGLTVDFMKKVNASLCVRGLRGIKDLEEEGDLAAVNKGLYADALNEPGASEFSQVYFATSKPELRHVSSSFARAINAAERDVSLLRYVSADVAAKMIAKRQEMKR